MMNWSTNDISRLIPIDMLILISIDSRIMRAVTPISQSQSEIRMKDPIPGWAPLPVADAGILPAIRGSETRFMMAEVPYNALAD